MAAAGDRRSIEELLARYELEPSLQDVYVEGPTDRALVELGLSGLAPVDRLRVYEIDDIDVPGDLLRSKGLPIGNKSRLIALAEELQVATTRNLRGSVVCLADLDFDGALVSRRPLDLLVYTSRASLDAVLITPNVVRKLLVVVLLADQSPDELLDQMLPILNERFLQRLACAELGIVSTHPQLARVCTFDGHTLRCDTDTYLARLLHSAAAGGERESFVAAMNAHRSDVARDPSSWVHVDDFLALLHLCGRRIRPKAMPDATSFRHFLFGLIEARQVAELPEIKEIAFRLRGG
jgi:hypothetical protein